MTRTISIAGKATIGNGRTFIIAEVGSNHAGSLALALEHIDAAAESGADAVKFQSLSMDKLYKDPPSHIRELHARIDMEETWCADLLAHAARRGVLFFSSPTYLDSVSLLDRLDVPLFKLASAQVGTFPQLVQAVAETGRPTFLSSGIADYGGLSDAVRRFEQAGNHNYAIMHCNAIYPTPAERVFLGRMATYRKMFHCPVGFSDHTDGTAVALAAVALGAAVIEKHFLLDTHMDTSDAPFSIGPDTFRGMVGNIRAVEAARGDAPRLELEPEEKRFREAIRYRLVLRCNKSESESFGEGDFDYLRSAQGIDAAHAALIMANMEAARPLKAGQILDWTCLRGRD
ncbi:MAG: N,N'-diacetyllegionaminic acid synthase [Nitrosomonadaceae bacterium]|nr:N,N'-diacetyllegionaminic acid synthase [Nitrosomonadaceae bacterium]